MDISFNVDVLRLDLTAGLSDLRIQYRGEKIIYKEGTTDLNIRFNSSFAPQIPTKPKDMWTIPYDELYISANAAPETIILFLISDRNIGVQAQTINVDNVTSIVNAVTTKLTHIGGTAQTGYDLLGGYRDNADSSYGSQIAKHNSGYDAPVVIHTVSAGKTLLLESVAGVCYVPAGGVGGVAYIAVRDVGDNPQYHLLDFLSPVVNAIPNSIAFSSPLRIPAGYDIYIAGALAANLTYANIKGREI